MKTVMPHIFRASTLAERVGARRGPMIARQGPSLAQNILKVSAASNYEVHEKSTEQEKIGSDVTNARQKLLSMVGPSSLFRWMFS
jgi:hypothetical protein